MGELTRRGFLATILGAATAAMVPTPAWLWTPVADAPPILPTALLTVEQILNAFAVQVERQMNPNRALRLIPDLSGGPDRAGWSRNQRGALERARPRGRQILVNLVLPRTVSPAGPDLETLLADSAKGFFYDLSTARLSVPLGPLGNDLQEGLVTRVASGLALRGVVYPDQAMFHLPDDQFVLRIQAQVI